MNPRDFHGVAVDLMAKGGAACFRTAIGRAYYAAFQTAVSVLRGCGCTISKGPQAHGDVILRLQASNNSAVQRVGSQLRDLKGKRNDADYDLEDQKVEDIKTVKFWVADAKRNIDTLDKIVVGGPDREAIISAIRAWEDKMKPHRQN